MSMFLKMVQLVCACYGMPSVQEVTYHCHVSSTLHWLRYDWVLSQDC